jgi:HCNGP-like protein
MNGAVTRNIPMNVTVEDEPEPGDPPPRPPSPPIQQQQIPLSSSPKVTLSPGHSQSPQIAPLDPPALDEPEIITRLAYANALIRESTMPILPPDLDDFGIPPSPPGTPDPSLSNKLDNFRQLRERGVHFNDRLGGNKGFRNPKLLEKLRGYVGIEDEYGSLLPSQAWNPHSFSEDQYFDKIGIDVCFAY